jgi:hypothetical protein
MMLSDRDKRLQQIRNEVYNAVADVLIKYDMKDANEAFKQYIQPFALQIALTGKLDCEE